ncbi:MAG: ABC transporter permease [Coprococcus sp.]|nr:ABC transporter permease [Coprococcus sp.]
MLAKLSLRNVKRSVRDYMVYLLTMTVVVALMYAFGSLIFQNELTSYFDMVDLMAVMIILATVFIVLIVAWLIHYMVRFMLEKKSTEFGIYMLLGMPKKTILRLYMTENIILGGLAFLAGLFLSVLLQQVLATVMFSMVRMEYHLHFSFSRETILTTMLCYAGCYLLALLRCGWKFRKLNIHGLMNAKRQNEEIKEKNEEVKRILLPISIIFILLFWACFGHLTNAGEIVLFLIGLVLTIYLFYLGLSAWIICYIRKKGNGIYRGGNLFLLRQFASKVRTMQFTMGTLTALFTLALMGSSIALMFNEYENTALDGKFPFDVQIHGSAEASFAQEKKVIDQAADVSAYYSYSIYTDGENQVNTWMLTHLKDWGTMFRKGQKMDAEPDLEEIEDFLQNDGVYYPYDTYMGISDYNHLREMLGYEKVCLRADEYLVQVKPRLESDVQEIGDSLKLKNAAGDGLLSFAGIASEPFSQDGHNGADYVVIVPDAVLSRMHPYYAELVADIKGRAASGLQKKLDALTLNTDERTPIGHDYKDLCYGSDTIITYAVVYAVRDNLIPEIKYMLASLIIPLFYIGLVFVCVAVTVLSVQQLGDSSKYRFRYDVLAKLGMGKPERGRLIFKQLAAYYLCPAILAMIISGKMILFISARFVDATGVPAYSGSFFAKSIALFFGIYLVYFAVTYVGFKRNTVEPPVS